MAEPSRPYDENLVCPLTGGDLFRGEHDLATRDGRHRYDVDDGILRMFVDPEAPTAGALSGTTRTVQDFYTDAPFPNYGDFDDIQAFIARAETGFFARSLSRQLPPRSKVLEVGCGTGQLSNYLAATTDCRVYAADMTLASLRLARDFAAKNAIEDIEFLQMNLFHPCVRPESMDFVISNGVLHHTADPRGAFRRVASLVRPGGHVAIGLYNHIGRLRTDLRRWLYGILGESALRLDPRLRRKDLSTAKRRAWTRDQYLHPRESKHSMSETLRWFAEEGVEFVSSRPKIVGPLEEDERIFEAVSPGSALRRLATETEMLFSHYGTAGGLYLMIGRRR